MSIVDETKPSLLPETRNPGFSGGVSTPAEFEGELDLGDSAPNAVSATASVIAAETSRMRASAG